MNTRFFVFVTFASLLVTSTASWGQAQSNCPSASAFAITTGLSSVSIAAPITVGWQTSFYPDPIITGNSITARVLSTSSTTPPLTYPPLVVNGLSAGNYTLSIVARYQPPGFNPPPTLLCPPVSTTFAIAGAEVSISVPGLSVFSCMLLSLSLFVVAIFVIRRRERIMQGFFA